MSELSRPESYRESLDAFGAELSRWPEERAQGAREAILRDPELRRIFEAERALDGLLADLRDGLDQEIARASSVSRVRPAVLQRLPKSALATLGWQKVAAAVLMAGMLGSAMDLFLGEPASDPLEITMLDPLYSLEDPGLQ